MKKTYRMLFTVLSLVLMTSSALFSADIWIQRFDTSSTVDLASNKFWFPTNVWGASDGYNDSQIIAVVGVKESSELTTVTFDSDWYLTSVSDPSLKRPFSVCLVPRVSQKNFPNQNSTNYPRYGYGGDFIAPSFMLPKTNGGVVMTDGVNIVTQNGTYNYGNVSSAWIDVVLVLDPVLQSDGTLPGVSTDICNVAAGDDYLGAMTVTVASGDMSESSTFYMNGYFGGTKPTYSAQLVVTPDAVNTNAFNLKNGSGPTHIADVDFITVSNTAQANDYYLFVSSSSDYNVAGQKFEFKKNNSSSASNAYNSCEYVIVPTSTTGLVPTGLEFDGTTAYTGSSDTSNYLKALSTSHVTGNGKGTIWNYDFHGSLNIRLTGATDDLLAGVYSTDIYVHVITGI
ncbi:MAG: hypothetical protein SPD11_05635 [Sphaerochaetaceae bacterium]|nr:hypothetical protein [Sphaerochaetaceae bacterium]